MREFVLPDLFAIGALEAELSGFDACFFCLGISSVGLSEADYTRITFDLTIAIAELLARLNPGMTFVYVSGTGTDSSGQSRLMWARVKGRTENALRDLPFKAVFLFRPGCHPALARRRIEDRLGPGRSMRSPHRSRGWSDGSRPR